MEDRQPSWLHVELVRAPDDVEARAAAVARAGWQHVSTWTPCERQMEGLPRRQAPSLGVVIGERTAASEQEVEPADAATTVVDFKRYPRPSQGICAGELTSGILLVMISAKHPENAQALRDWGDFNHLRHIAAVSVPGYRTITPWENASGGEPRFCHMYEMVTDDPQATFELMTPLVHEALSPEEFKTWQWHPENIIEESRTYRRTR